MDDGSRLEISFRDGRVRVAEFGAGWQAMKKNRAKLPSKTGGTW